MYDSNPRPAPCTVTLADPVEGALPLLVRDIDCASTEYQNALERDPDRSPTVTDVTLQVPPCPLACWHAIEVSETHKVLSLIVKLIRAATVYIWNPRLAPKIVTLVEPVEARFCGPIQLTTPDVLSIVNDAVKVPD